MISEEKFEKLFELVEKAISGVCSEFQIAEEDAKDFASQMWEKFFKDDCRLLKAAEDKGAAYIKTMVRNTAIDQHRKEKGQWRPSTKAKKLGDIAVRLEKYLYHQYIPFQEAISLLRTECKAEGALMPSVETLEAWSIKLYRMPKSRREISIDSEKGNVINLSFHSRENGRNPLKNPEEESMLENTRKVHQTCQSIIQNFSSRLSKNQKLMIKLHFEHGYSMSKIADMLSMSQPQVNYQVKSILKNLKKELLKSGINENDIIDIIKHLSDL